MVAGSELPRQFKVQGLDCAEEVAILKRVVAFLASLALALGLLYLTAEYWRPLLRHSSAGDAAAPARLETPPDKPYLMVQSTRSDTSFRRLLLVPIHAPDGLAYETNLACDRATFAASYGICLVNEGQDSPAWYAHVFDERFESLRKIRLAGVPSRARLSPDGRLAAISVSEHTHEDPRIDFIARTIIVQMDTGAIQDVREFRYLKDDRPVHARNLGVWGVTFAADANRFFATLEMDGTNYLVEGDLAKRTGRVMDAGMECPSLSPDNRRLVYKRRLAVGDDARLRVYDLQTGTDVAIETERRSIVDQVDWIDNERVMYHVSGTNGADIWTVRVDGTEPPKILRSYAYSPSIVR